MGYFDKLICFSICTSNYIMKIIKVHHINFIKRKCDFLEGPTWLKCTHWSKGMVILTKGLGYERRELFFIETFN